MEYIVIVVFAFLGLWLLGNLLTTVGQDYFIFRPTRLRARESLHFAEQPQEVWLSTPARGRIHALWFRRPDSEGVVLYFHGNSGNVARWGHLHHYFRRFDYDFFVFDYRGFGKSRGKQNEALLQADAEAVYAYLRRYYPASCIVIFGRSIGSGPASYLASRAPARQLILETPFDSMPGLFYSYYPFLPRVFAFKYRFRNDRYLLRVQCPVLILQGQKDKVVPYTCAERLRPRLKASDEFIRIPEGRHNDLLIYDIYNQKMRNWLRASAGKNQTTKYPEEDE